MEVVERMSAGMSLYLIPAEVAHLTGRDGMREQKRWLRDQGIQYTPGHKGEPLVRRRLLSIVSAVQYTETDRLCDLPATQRVYMIDEGADDSPVKIGVSDLREWQARQRIYELQNGNPRRLRFVASHPGTWELEQHIHRMLKPWRLSGEWFDQSAPDVRRFVATASRQGYRVALRELSPGSVPR